MVAVGFLAMGFGAFVAGGLSERWGRKAALIGSVVVFGRATALGGTSGDFTAFHPITCSNFTPNDTIALHPSNEKERPCVLTYRQKCVQVLAAAA